MTLPIKFRAWIREGEWEEDGSAQKYVMVYDLAFEDFEPLNDLLAGTENLMQFTGLKDTHGLRDIYEGDIILLDGKIGGNKYENEDLLKDETNLVIPSITSEDWQTAYNKVMGRGCKHSK